jgi:hypothetical protein
MRNAVYLSGNFTRRITKFMVVLIAFIVGFLMGFGASPNLLVGALCGVFFATFVWAMTGFKIGSSDNANQVHSTQLASQPDPKSPNGWFVYADGMSYTPEQFGYSGAILGSRAAAEDIDALFGAGQSGERLGLGKAVNADRSGAEMLAAIFSASVYLWYASFQLKVDEHVIARLIKGVRDFFERYQTNSGRKLPPEFVEFLIGLLGQLTPEIQLDVIAGSERTAGTLSSPMPSAKLFATILIKAYSHESAERSRWEQELASGDGVMLLSLVADGTLAIMVALSKEFQVRFQR